MTRPTFTLNKTLYPDMVKAECCREDGVAFEFHAAPQDVVPLRQPRCVVPFSRTSFEVLKLERVPGPPVDGAHPYRLHLKRLT